MEADPTRLLNRDTFNLAVMTFMSEELAAGLSNSIPNFTIDDSTACQIELEPALRSTAMKRDILAKLNVKLDNPAQPV